MQDLAIELENRPGALAEMGEALGRAGASVEGGGAWLTSPGVAVGVGLAPAVSSGPATAIGHFLFHDADRARRALQSAGIRVLAQRDVVVLRLRQDEPGQLGKLSRRMSDAGVNIEALYSDHDHQLILVVDHLEKARAVSADWSPESNQGNSN